MKKQYGIVILTCAFCCISLISTGCSNKSTANEKAINELKSTVETLQEQVLTLKEENQTLTDKLDQLAATKNDNSTSNDNKELADIKTQLDALKEEVENDLIYERGEELKALEGRVNVLEAGDNDLVIYTASTVDYSVYPVNAVKVDTSLTLKLQLQQLANELSKGVFNNFEIEVTKIEDVKGKKVAVINLKDNEKEKQSWESDFFGGSCGGSVTSSSLVETFLQKQYKGAWIDGVTFTYNGEDSFTDHVEILSEISYR